LIDSTNDRAPWLGQGEPLYPPLELFCRITGPAIAGTSPRIYPALMQQPTGGASLRDRGPCYVQEANDIALGSGIVDCRLIGSYAGLPIFGTTCCPTAPFSSSSSSGG